MAEASAPVPSSKARPAFRMRLENFRLFRDSGWFRIAPLTCLVGRNSSGKSTVISSILLLKQSLERETVRGDPGLLTLSGPYCDLGSFTDLVHGHSGAAEATLSFSLPFAMLREVTPGGGLAVVNSPFQGRPRMIRHFSRAGPLPRTSSAEEGVTLSMTFSGDQRFGPSLCRLQIDVSRVGVAKFVRTAKGERGRHWRLYPTGLPRQSLELYDRNTAMFPMVGDRSEVYDKAAPRTKGRIRMFVEAYRAAANFLRDTIRLSELIGPFRTPPVRLYSFGGLSANRAGQTGEQAVDLLLKEALLQPRGQRPLHKAVSFWMKRLQLAESLDVKDLAKRLNLFEVDVRDEREGTKANLTDVGFGISQVLPVLVQGLLTPRGGIFLVQQPEIHLHPDAQAGLADFFIFLAGEGVITVVETHSEYFLIRLRRRLAEGGRIKGRPRPSGSPKPPRLAPGDVEVLLTGSFGADPAVERLEIDDSFQFSNLPSGFMDQALEDRMALLKALGKRHA